MFAAIKNGKMIKGLVQDFSPGPVGSEIIWLPNQYLSLLDNKIDPDFVYPDDPRLTMDQAELDMVNEVNADRAQKVLDIQTNLPSWSQVESYLDGLANLAEAKIALKKIARVVYWLAKNTSK